MPAIDTPFVMELRPGEELKLAQAPQSTTAPDDASAATAGTNAFAKNQFRAMVTGITFLEEVEEDGGSGEGSNAAAAADAAKTGRKHAVVRVTLLAHLRDSIESTAAPTLKAATLASCNFSNNTATGTSSSSSSSNGNGASAAAARKSGRTASAISSSSTSVMTTAVGSTVQFRAPLLFHSGGNVQSLSVVAVDMATTAGSSGSSGSVRRYQGSRRFLVRLHGLQQTFLTQEQVLLLAQR